MSEKENPGRQPLPGSDMMFHVHGSDEDAMLVDGEEVEGTYDEMNVAPSRVVTPLDAVDIGSGMGGALCGRGVVHRGDQGTATASLVGVVMRVDRLTWVQHPRGRYVPKVGDVVVGEVREVMSGGVKGWRVNIGSIRHANLLLAAVHLPGGVTRRRTAEDEQDLRELFEEGDYVSAEVQAAHSDGSVALHTRSTKYGKLTRGQLVHVPPAMVVRMKQHFHEGLGPLGGVRLILGCNGFIWVGRPAVDSSRGKAGKRASKAMEVRVANTLRLLAEKGALISIDTMINELEKT